MKTLLNKNKVGLILYIIGALLSAVSGVTQTLGLSVGFSILESQNQKELIIKIVLAALLGLSPALIQLLSRFMRIGFMRDVLVDVRHLAYQKMMKIPIEQFRAGKREEYVSMLVNDINIFERDYFLSILNIFYAFGSFAIGLVIMLFIHPVISMAIIVFSIFILIASKCFEKPMRQQVKNKQVANASYNEQVSNVLNGLQVIKLYQVEDEFRGPFHAIVQHVERIKRKFNLLQASQWNILDWIASLFNVILYLLAAYFFFENEISVTSLILILNFSGQMIWSNIHGMNMINTLKGSIDIFYRITSQPQWEHGDEEYHFENQIKIEDVSFSYGNHQVLDHVNLVINKGSKVLIYGPSGTGKTTLLNCIAQNLTSYTGQIKVDELELKNINFESMMSKTGYVRQQHFMFDDTIQNNIILDQKLDEARLNQVLKDVDLLNWVESLENGVNHTLVSNGNNISGGQKQRLSIARELYRDVEVLFVDEPSASLDDETASKLYDTLLKLNKTLIIVSHRHLKYLSQRVDQIIQFSEKGDVYVEENEVFKEAKIRT